MVNFFWLYRSYFFRPKKFTKSGSQALTPVNLQGFWFQEPSRENAAGRKFHTLRVFPPARRWQHIVYYLERAAHEDRRPSAIEVQSFGEDSFVSSRC